MEASLREVLPNLVPAQIPFRIVTFQGKTDLLNKLEARMRGYARWSRITGLMVDVLVDQDQQSCEDLKARMEQAASSAGLFTKTSPAADGTFQVLNRVVVEELEAWFFGDVAAVCRAFPGVSPHLASRASYRHPDAIRGGTAGAFARVLQRAGHHRGGLRKVEAAGAVSRYLDVSANRSPSFQTFRAGLLELIRAVPTTAEEA